jgi:hypothetical protein
VAADAARRELGAEVGHDLGADLADRQPAEPGLDVVDEHALVADARPVGEVRHRVLGPPLPREVSQRALALLVEGELPHRPPDLEVRRKGLDLLLAGPVRKGLLAPRRAASGDVPAQAVAAVGQLLDLQAALPLSIAIDEVAQRAPEPVQPPHHERVALTEVIERPRQLGPLAERAAGRVAEDPGASRRGERIMLKRELLLDRGDPGVAEQR